MEIISCDLNGILQNSLAHRFAQGPGLVVPSPESLINRRNKNENCSESNGNRFRLIPLLLGTRIAIAALNLEIRIICELWVERYDCGNGQQKRVPSEIANPL